MGKSQGKMEFKVNRPKGTWMMLGKLERERGGGDQERNKGKRKTTWPWRGIPG